MNRPLRITVLADNQPGAPGMLSEHGLSFLVEADGRRILFDTGQGAALAANLSRLGIPLDPLDALVFSHGHYDHTGGMDRVAEVCAPRRIYLHPAALARKYARRSGSPPRSIGMPAASRRALNEMRHRVVFTNSLTEVCPGVWCTGEIPRLPGRGPEPCFFLDEEGTAADPLLDDQALFVETGSGIVVLAGCAHAGVEATLDHVCRLTGRPAIRALAGGIHLKGAPEQAWEEVAAVLERRRIQALAPCHCTGLEAQSYFRSRLPTMIRETGAGSALIFD